MPLGIAACMRKDRGRKIPYPFLIPKTAASLLTGEQKTATLDAYKLHKDHP
jgi:hypothetical protein